VLANPPDAKVNGAALDFSASGTCLASPEGFNAKLEPANIGVAWTTSFSSMGSVDDHGAATEVGQTVDTASFGAGPRMHAPAAQAYSGTSKITIESSDGSVTLHAGMLSGTFTAGPFAGRSFSLSGFDLKQSAHGEGVTVFGSATSPVAQTLSLVGGPKFERLCVMTVSTSPRR